MKCALGFILALSVWNGLVSAWAEPLPPVPVIPAEDSDVLPPSGVETPVLLPSDDDVKRASTENSRSQASHPPPTFAPTPVATTSTPGSFLAPSPAPSSKESLGKERTIVPAPPGGGLFDYFPATLGHQAEFVYLKAGKGEIAPRRFTIQCVDYKSNPNGSVVAVLESSQTGSPVRAEYLISNEEVVHTRTGDQTFQGDTLIKMPEPLKNSLWEQPEENYRRMFKTTLGQAQVLQKTYPDCLIVEEIDVRDGKKVGVRYFYYAKGIGLISLETYTTRLKLIQTQSFVLNQEKSLSEDPTSNNGMGSR
jgi:hypothetical protein